MPGDPPDLAGRPTTSDVAPPAGASFDAMNLRRELMMGIRSKGFLRPSPIQAAAIPRALEGRDVMARAKNGTGKTASFLIPVLNRLDLAQPHVQALILLPTRELAMQTAAVTKELGKFMDGLQVMMSIGGGSLKDDLVRLKQPPIHVFVSTPGRAHDLAKQGALNLRRCHMLVGDEADKLLSGDIFEIVRLILDHHLVARPRQLLFFSATFPISVKPFKRAYMPPERLSEINLMTSELTLEGVTQYYAYAEERLKVHCLSTLFKKLNICQTIVFCNSVQRVEMLAQAITRLGISCFYTHAKMAQEHRNRVFHSFCNFACRTLVCTDVLTRGIDIQAVNVVINFDFPRCSETYLHRIGRSGRFGHYGLAINFITPHDCNYLLNVERELRTQIGPIPPVVDPELYRIGP